MIFLYYKLKLRILINRMKKEEVEEVLGKMTGYILLWFIISGIGYGILNLLFSNDLKKIRIGIIIYFVAITLLNIGDNFKKIYENLYERADKYILLTLPMKNRDIIAINLLDNTLEYMKTYLLLVCPVFFSLVYYDRNNVKVFGALMLGCLCFCFVIVSFFTILLLFTIILTKGKNIKVVSLILTLLFSGLTTFLVYSNRYIGIIDSKLLINIIIKPIGYVNDILFYLDERSISVSTNILQIVIYTIAVIMMYCYVFDLSINKGTLLIDTEYIVELPINRQLGNNKWIKKLMNKDYYLFKKDIIGLFSNLGAIKILFSTVLMCVLIYKYLLTDINIVFLGIFILIKSFVLIIQMTHYLYQYEMNNLALIFTILDNKSIMKSKSIVCGFVVIPFIVLLDMIMAVIVQFDALLIISCCFDIIFCILLVQNCSYNIIQFSEIKNYRIGFSIKGVISYIENIIIVQLPVIGAYVMVLFVYYNYCFSIAKIIAVMCCAIGMCSVSFLVLNSRKKHIYENVVEFL